MPLVDRRHSAAFGLLIASALTGCRQERDTSNAPTYDGEVSAILAAKCTDCHRDSASGGWVANSYLSTIACVRSGAPATLPSDDTAPLARAVGDSTHYLLLTDREREIIRAWVRAGAPKFQTSVHDPAFVDPRSEKSHARMLRAERWKSMLDPNADTACGRCHDGAPSGRPAKVDASAPRATACTSCHKEPEGVLACSTCHGDGTRAAPPRDPCFFPEDVPRAGAHLAHVGPNAIRGEGLPCSTCHPVPSTAAGANILDGVHGNGSVDVAITSPIAGPSSYDAIARTCTTGCHARAGAAKPKPAWTDRGPLACGDCHGAPPPQHYAGACTSCHHEANATGTGLTSTPVLHVNGKVDLGDGTGTCGACHGSGDDPWPKTGAHATHRAPSSARAVACETCHVVPKAYGPDAGHPVGGGAKVVFSGIADARDAGATYDAPTCKNVYCHGGGLVGTTPATPYWTDTSGASKTCTGCHGQPPSAPHPTTTTCYTCHRSVTDPAPDGGVILTSPNEHVDGVTNK